MSFFTDEESEESRICQEGCQHQPETGSAVCQCVSGQIMMNISAACYMSYNC